MLDPVRWLSSVTPWASDFCSPYKEVESCRTTRDFENDTTCLNQREVEVSQGVLCPSNPFGILGYIRIRMTNLKSCLMSNPNTHCDWASGMMS